ncbi:MAG: NAD(P)-binding domain-containing protein, partial [Bacteroidota bacterium]
HVELKDGIHRVTTPKGEYKTANIAVATGFYDVPRMLEVPGENLPKVKHYYDEAHHYVGQQVIVIGGANSACDVALETWQKGADVTMVVREPELYEKVKYWILPNIKNRIKEGSIKAYFNSNVTRIEPDHVIIQTPETTIQIDNDFVLAMTGYKPDYDLLTRIGVPIKESPDRKPDFDEETLMTSVAGIYVAGVVNAGLRTSKLFIENTRHHGSTIVTDILSRRSRS